MGIFSLTSQHLTVMKMDIRDRVRKTRILEKEEKKRDKGQILRLAKQQAAVYRLNTQVMRGGMVIAALYASYKTLAMSVDYVKERSRLMANGMGKNLGMLQDETKNLVSDMDLLRFQAEANSGKFKLTGEEMQKLTKLAMVLRKEEMIPLSEAFKRVSTAAKDASAKGIVKLGTAFKEQGGSVKGFNEMMKKAEGRINDFKGKLDMPTDKFDRSIARIKKAANSVKDLFGNMATKVIPVLVDALAMVVEGWSLIFEVIDRQWQKLQRNLPKVTKADSIFAKPTGTMGGTFGSGTGVVIEGWRTKRLKEIAAQDKSKYRRTGYEPGKTPESAKYDRVKSYPTQREFLATMRGLLDNPNTTEKSYYGTLNKWAYETTQLGVFENAEVTAIVISFEKAWGAMTSLKAEKLVAAQIKKLRAAAQKIRETNLLAARKKQEKQEAWEAGASARDKKRAATAKFRKDTLDYVEKYNAFYLANEQKLRDEFRAEQERARFEQNEKDKESNLRNQRVMERVRLKEEDAAALQKTKENIFAIPDQGIVKFDDFAMSVLNLALSFDVLKLGANAAFDAWITGSGSMSEAFTRATAEVLKNIAKTAAVNAISSTAEGLVSLAKFNFWSAGKHFAAAAAFGSAAYLAGRGYQAMQPAAAQSTRAGMERGGGGGGSRNQTIILGGDFETDSARRRAFRLSSMLRQADQAGAGATVVEWN